MGYHMNMLCGFCARNLHVKSLVLVRNQGHCGVIWSVFCSVAVSEEAKPCQCNKIEGSHTRKWPPLLCIWIHEGKSLSANEG